MSRSTNPTNQGVVRIWFIFGDSSLSERYVIVPTNTGTDTQTDRQTKATTMSADQNFALISYKTHDINLIAVMHYVYHVP